jgi:hypothetical protein
MKCNTKEAYCHSFRPTSPKTIIAKYNLDFKFIYIFFYPIYAAFQCLILVVLIFQICLLFLLSWLMFLINLEYQGLCNCQLAVILLFLLILVLLNLFDSFGLSFVLFQ